MENPTKHSHCSRHSPEKQSQLYRKLRWIALAFVHPVCYWSNEFISTDIASVPLLWIIPLPYIYYLCIVFSNE